MAPTTGEQNEGKQLKEGGNKNVCHAHSQIRGQLPIKCAETKAEGDETVEGDDAEYVEWRLHGSQNDP